MDTRTHARDFLVAAVNALTAEEQDFADDGMSHYHTDFEESRTVNRGALWQAELALLEHDVKTLGYPEAIALFDKRSPERRRALSPNSISMLLEMANPTTQTS